MSYHLILYESRERVGLITLNRPEKLNALNTELRDELDAALAEANADTEVRALILTGAGRAFSAGADIGGGESRGLMAWVDRESQWVERRSRILDLPKPIIAAVNGYCLGLGLEYAISCDLLIAAEDARFGAPEIRFGSIAPSLLPWLVGPQWAKRLILSGDMIDARTAKEIGLVIEVVPPDQLLDAAFRLARRLAHVPPIAIRLNKRAIDGALDMAGRRLGMDYGAMVAAICHTMTPEAATSDGRNLEEIRRTQGMRAFLEARDAPFQEPWP